SPENIYLAQGELWWDYDRDEYYEAFMDSRTPNADPFPILPNLDPDFAGNYAWSGEGSEEYVMADDHYLWAGTYYTSKGVPIESDYAGASYDKSSNTLTLNGYHGEHIDVNLMGNGFKIKLVGENSVGFLRLWGAGYGGSVTFTGDGSIVINEEKSNSPGLMLECEDSYSCIMIDRNAKVEVFGRRALLIHRTRLETAIYMRGHMVVTGGILSNGEFIWYAVNDTDENGNFLYDQNGNPVIVYKSVKEIGEELGMDLYDYSVINRDGAISDHVLFEGMTGY
ncbi:MAG: hypothetical protein IKY02_04465, partial [Lachnospiraceae bacterium]|nr:hypothetical protein [Lachnospiraceae bacterium]